LSAAVIFPVIDRRFIVKLPFASLKVPETGVARTVKPGVEGISVLLCVVIVSVDVWVPVPEKLKTAGLKEIIPAVMPVGNTGILIVTLVTLADPPFCTVTLITY